MAANKADVAALSMEEDQAPSPPVPRSPLIPIRALNLFGYLARHDQSAVVTV